MRDRWRPPDPSTPRRKKAQGRALGCEAASLRRALGLEDDRDSAE